MNEILVCFAVKQEAKFFNCTLGSTVSAIIVITGIGQRNARNAITSALASQRPAMVLSCGFAGGLRPDLKTGEVLFAADADTELHAALIKGGARPGRFHCSERIITMADEKKELWKTTSADAVEMESEIICAVSRQQNIPSATVRVILDTATENLPLDFNCLMNARQQMDFGRLALVLMKSPRKIIDLLKLQKQTRVAGQNLAKVLVSVINLGRDRTKHNAPC